jgi:hypothetical protein
LIRPEFWSDERMAALPESTRLVYIGLWSLCDDAGYFDRNARQIAGELFRYETPKRRERRVAQALVALEEAGRIRYLDCGQHGIVPTIPDHRIKGGEALFTIQKRHERRCSVALRRTTSDYLSDSVSDSDSVYESGSPISETRRSLRDVSKEAGGFVASLASRKPA